MRSVRPADLTLNSSSLLVTVRLRLSFQAGDTVSGNSNENTGSLLGKGENAAGSMANTAEAYVQGTTDAG